MSENRYAQMLKNVSDEDALVLTEMFDKVRPEAMDAFVRVGSDGLRSNKDELLSTLPQVVRICWDKSGIRDAEWIASDFEKWIDEEQEILDYRFKSAYMRMDAVVQAQIWYADIHGNRYLKQNLCYDDSKRT